MDGCEASAAAPAVMGTARAQRHTFVLPATEELPELALDLTVAPALQPHASSTVLYVLDPEPILFGACCLHTYAGAGYFANAPSDAPESVFRHLHIVGIGHAVAAYGADERSWDSNRLRALRRRDFPPCDHPTNNPARGENANSRRLATALATHVFLHVESNLLPQSATGGEPSVRRALLGSSYSAVLALQVLLCAPASVDAFILGSPSVPFDPEILEWLRWLDVPWSRWPNTASEPTDQPGVFVAYGALEREPPPPSDQPQRPEPGFGFSHDRRNVHRHIPDQCEVLAAKLRELGVAVDGAHSIVGEDHTSLKLSLVSRGLSWLVERWTA